MKYKSRTKTPKPYLKRIFIVNYFGGFCGYAYNAIKHELPTDATEIFFEVDKDREYVNESTYMDGHYFDVFIEHYDKHGKLNHTESLKPIRV